MNKEKLTRLNRYVEDLKNKLSSPTPDKHCGHPETYRQFLEREIAASNKKIESLKLEVGGTGK